MIVSGSAPILHTKVRFAHGVIFFCLVLLFQSAANAGQIVDKRSDLISIHEAAGTQERAVPYLHDQHAEFMKKQNKSCVACHPKQGKHNWLSPKYKRRISSGLFQDNDPKNLKKLYHGECIGCHERTAAAGSPSGPTSFFCGDCHGAKEKYVSNLEPLDMGKSLHMRHIMGIDKNAPIFSCKLCHHTYDAQSGGTIYKPGTEESCRYCHKQQATEQHGEVVLSLADASHLVCISCHRARIEQKKTHGPISCSGCHGPEEQKSIQARNDLYQATHKFPQLDRGQSDYCTVSIADGIPSSRWEHKVDFMPLVSFPHRLHEDNNKSCQVCHHESMEPCAKKCHTLDGSPKGGFLTLREVMHDPENSRGCVGCHAQKQSEKQCAGCHGPEHRGVLRQSQCKACHNIDLEDPRKDDFSKTFLERDFGIEAQKAMSRRPRITSTYPDADIPEIVKMGKLAKDWAPAEMPHRKIVKKLVAAAGASSLAAYFHSSQGTFCQGCHHNQPAAKIPSACSHCHGNASSRSLGDTPDLKEAYHTACIGCHQRMELDVAKEGRAKTAPGPDDCQECHKAK